MEVLNTTPGSLEVQCWSYQLLWQRIRDCMGPLTEFREVQSLGYQGLGGSQKKCSSDVF